MSSEGIKIVTFEREDIREEQKPLQRGEVIMNIVLFSKIPKSLLPLEKIIKEKYLSDVNLVKCNKLSNLNYALNTCKHSIKTICIADQEINSEAIEIIMKNQTVMNNIDHFTLCLYLKDIQSIDKMNFHIKNVALVTEDEDKIIQYVENKIQTYFKLQICRSTSTINSEDRALLQQKFLHKKQPLENIYSSRDKEKEQLNYNNGVPGVGMYDVNKGHHVEGHGFGSSPNRSNPKEWRKPGNVFGRMEQK